MPAEHRPDGGPACHGPFGIIILAGGAGRRLGGQDKPSLVVGDRTLIASVVLAGTEAGAAQVIVVGPPRRDLDGVCFVSEEPPGAGPVPALRRGLAAATLPWTAVLAADLPFLRAAHLRVLLAAAAGRPGAVLADDTGRPQWLAGCWATETLREAAAGYRGTTLRGLLGPLGPVLVGPPPAAGEPPAWLDCDTPEALAVARAWLNRPVPGRPLPVAGAVRGTVRVVAVRFGGGRPGQARHRAVRTAVSSDRVVDLEGGVGDAVLHAQELFQVGADRVAVRSRRDQHVRRRGRAGPR